ncbi:2-hydroxypenta-2,4-dienoate hydratase [Bacillus sp. OxB-1]|uniref:2-keto-4-pentenoate hydratase n=1 Tax=Bacillus sp. (strain OxB-1) TaxID=98228 RepID=UPI000581BE8C|nr:2-keto-4-pentenoate hydratase [Bacillus sp. OxB-1]BAQ10975.1 2-hydroxypenta-2,4-dienoate hydratase [Bacillus sp. OxB-1]
MIPVTEIAEQLLVAERSKKTIAPLTSQYPNLNLEEAYQIQLQFVEAKKNAGATIVGKKIGATSQAIQQMFGVDKPDYGHLLDTMVYMDGDVIPLERLIQPKVECEIAFVLKEDIIGPKITPLDVIQATDYILPAIEIIDSRIADWQIQFEDTVSDNGSSALVVLGSKGVKLEGLNLETLGMVVTKNGEIIQNGAGANVLGNPIYAVVWLANALAEFNVPLLAGEIILTGAFTSAVDAKDGDAFIAEFAHIGSVSAVFKEGGK